MHLSMGRAGRQRRVSRGRAGQVVLEVGADRGRPVPILREAVLLGRRGRRGGRDGDGGHLMGRTAGERRAAVDLQRGRVWAWAPTLAQLDPTDLDATVPPNKHSGYH